MLKVNQSYQYDNAVDYYAGRVTGDILSMIGGIIGSNFGN
ncbi:MAG: hypothetical protein K0S61_1921 [Anaerocolumna sp.]|jgi:hypothetical protein|nr:hypothetical protein [Anaerocolumna sp.]